MSEQTLVPGEIRQRLHDQVHGSLAGRVRAAVKEAITSKRDVQLVVQEALQTETEASQENGKATRDQGSNETGQDARL